MYTAKNTTNDPGVALNKNAAGKGTFFQPKLTVNEPGDSYEQEADAMADHVMRMTDTSHNENAFFKPAVSHVQRKCQHCEEEEKKLQRKESADSVTDQAVHLNDPATAQSVFFKPNTDQVQRKCQHCEEEEKKLHRNESTGGEVQGRNDLDSYVSSLSSQGQPLSETSRKFFEPRFGRDFSNVRVHNDSVAAKSAQSINALAYTTGNNIVFNNGQYSPESDSGKRLMAHELTHVVQQNKSTTVRRKRRPETSSMITGIGIVSWDKSPELRLRKDPSTESEAIGTLKFNTRFQIISQPLPSWYQIATIDGKMGYVAKSYVKTNLPEPTATLHRVEGGVKGTAIAIAEKYFHEDAGKWGMDLRFYINVIAYLNKINIPDSIDGWRQVHFDEGNFIWIPGKNFTHSLKGIVNSGSITYNAADALGVAKFIEKYVQKIEDFRTAIRLSDKYIGIAVKKYGAKAIRDTLMGMAQMILIGIAILAVTTVVFAAFGGPGGAALGFEIGMLLIEWLGLAMLIKWLAGAINDVASAFGIFVIIVWDADGNMAKLDKGARQFAEAIGLLIGKLIEAMAMFVMAKGLKVGVEKFKSSKFANAEIFDFLKNKAEGKAAEPPIDVKQPNASLPKDPNLDPSAEKPARTAEKPKDPPTRAGRQSGSSFMSDCLKKISNPNHPLHFLTEPGQGKGAENGFRWRTTLRTTKAGNTQIGRYQGAESGPVVQAGHQGGLASGAPQQFMLEDADFNQTDGNVIETKGAYSFKDAVLIDDVPVDIRTALMFENLGLLPKGTVAAAPQIAAPVP